MIQFNLLPDVKLEYLKAQRAQRLVWAIAILASSVSAAILLVILGLNGLQQKHLKDLSKDITTNSAKLKGEKQIGRILTVQNQLDSLTTLHDSKPATTRLFDYLNQITPSNVSIGDLTIDFASQTLTLTATTDSLSSVNQYVDTLKFTTYKVDKDPSAPAFGNVVLASFSLANDAQDKNKAANFSVNLNYDTNIFDITKTVKLTVPKKTTTRSELTKPPELFQATPSATTTTDTPTAKVGN